MNSFKSGKFLCIYKHHFGQFIQKAKLRKSNQIILGGANLEEVKHSKYYIDFTKDFANIFKDIEENQMARSECSSLIKELRSRNTQLKF
jgi:hypothetical protein